MNQLIRLPYSLSELSPFFSKENIYFHYCKHHYNYVKTLNLLIKNTEFETYSLEEIILNSCNSIFNNASQVWNHNFYWNCLSPKNNSISSSLKYAIEIRWGDFTSFKDNFIRSAMTHFGSGWIWLVKKNDGSLEIFTTNNANNPINTPYKPLLTCDVWEHAYYIDYRNLRKKYLENYWKLINWQFVNENYYSLNQ